MEERAGRIGYWISGIAHLALILWAILGGALFRPQPSAPVRMTEVATMSGAEFESYAAAARGAGPVGQEATAIASLPEPPSDTTVAPAPTDSPAPDTADSAQELASPDVAEARPDLSDFQRRDAVDVATDLPEAPTLPVQEEAAPDTPVATTRPALPDQPSRPAAPQQDEVAEPVAPRSAVALDSSPRPQARPEGLVEAYNARIAAQQEAERRAAAEAQAAAEAAARQEAEEQEAAERAAEEAERQAAAEAARQERERQAAEDQRRQEEARQQAEREAQAEEERQAAERAAREEEQRQAAAAREAERRRAEEEARQQEEERRAAAQREAEQREQERLDEERREAEARAEEQRRAEEAARQEEERRAAEEADRQALEDALREAQEAGGNDGSQSAATGADVGGNRQQIEGGSGASAAQDPLAAALAGALSQQNSEPEPAPDPMQLTPQPIRPTPLPDPEDHSDAGTAAGDDLPMGDPLSFAEKDGLRVAIQDCWNVGALSVEAARTTVSVGFEMTPDGFPEPQSLRLADYRGGSETAARQAFDVARRAILMCGRSGYPMPAEKYGRWRDVVVDFRPDGVGFD